jgi:hypothetical protein
MAALTESQWPTAIQELYRVTKPGGWVELNEGMAEHGYPENRDRHGALDIKLALYAKRRLKPNIGKELANLLADAGFVDITTVYRKVPIGKWGGELGELGSQNFESLFRGIKQPALDHGGFGVVKTGEEFDRLIDNLVEDWNNVPGYSWDAYISYARKPIRAGENRSHPNMSPDLIISYFFFRKTSNILSPVYLYVYGLLIIYGEVFISLIHGRSSVERSKCEGIRK